MPSNRDVRQQLAVVVEAQGADTLDAARHFSNKAVAQKKDGGMPMIGSTRACLKAALAALAVAVAQSALAPAWAQADYPNRPIRLIVGFAAGGGNDLFARLVGQKLSDNIGQPVIIENKPGAGGRIAVEFVKSQPADGYTIMVAASGQMAVAAAIYPKLSYHP